MSMKPIVKHSRVVYENPWISVREDAVVRSNGSEGVYGIVSMVAGSTVLAITEEHTVHLVREYRFAVGRETLEAISGAIKDSESPEDAARRELSEETGLSAREWIYVGQLDPFTAVINSPNHMLIASGLSRGAASPDAEEDLSELIVPYAEALAMAKRGEITHGATVALLYAAPFHLPSLRQYMESPR